MREIKVMLIMLTAMGLFAGSAFGLVNQSFEVPTEEYGYRFPAQWYGYPVIVGEPPEPDPTSVIVYHENDPCGAKFGDDYIEFAPSLGWCVFYPELCAEEEVVEGNNYTLELWLKRTSGSTAQTGVKLEWYNCACGVYPDTCFVGWQEYPHTFSADDTWEKQTVTAKAPATATHLRIVIFRDATNATTSTYYYDGYASSLDEPVPCCPTPAHDSSVDAATTNTISWSNPFTTDPCEIITATTVYFSVSDPNYIYDEDPCNVVGGVSAGDESATIPISLVDDEDYYWGVKITVATLGTFSTYDPCERTGAWHFDTFDAPPTVDMDWMYLWIDMDDGFDTDANDITVQLDGHVSDDGKSAVTYKWEVVYADASDPNVIWLDPNDIEKPRVVMRVTGDWEFGLTVQDERQKANDEETYGSMHVIVHPDACAAAKGDPADQLLAGDINEDCETDLLDVLAVVESWLECMSDKLIGVRPECTP